MGNAQAINFTISGKDYRIWAYPCNNLSLICLSCQFQPQNCHSTTPDGAMLYKERTQLPEGGARCIIIITTT
jgi:hypothetical protein